MYNLPSRKPEMEEFFVTGESTTDGELQKILGWCQGTSLILNVICKCNTCICKCWWITSIQNVPNFDSISLCKGYLP